jgi:integrase
VPTYRDTESRWRYRKVVRRPDGSTIRISGTPALNTKAAAEDAERAHIGRTLAPVATPAALPVSPPFDAYADAWLSTYPVAEGNRPTTIAVRESHIRLHLRPFFRSLPLTSITSERVSQLVAGLLSGGTLTPRTVRAITGTLRRMLQSAVEWGKLAALPKFPRQRVPKAKWDFLTKEEAAALLRAVPLKDYAKVLFALKTGARLGEQMAIRWEDIDLVRRKVHIRRNMGKHGTAGETKTGKDRTLPMTPALCAALKEAWVLAGGGGEVPRYSLIFTENGAPLKHDHFLHMLEKYLTAAGLRRLRWHDLRHTFASHLAMAGVPLKQIQEWLGHSSIITTMMYAHLQPESGTHLIDRLDEGDQPHA